jgi:phosphoribosylpyrophosphate synthetase
MTVVLTDDGIATGSTILASAKWMKDTQNCKELFIAAPVAPPEILDNLNECNEFESMTVVLTDEGALKTKYPFLVCVAVSIISFATNNINRRGNPFGVVVGLLAPFLCRKSSM